MENPIVIGERERIYSFRRPAGFTMMELLVVVAIIALLASLVGPILFKHIAPAKDSVARAQMENFMTALDAYFIDTGRFPTTQQGLAALRTKPEGESKWAGPYLKKEIPKDPWGNVFQYRTPGRSGGYEIASFGADGKEGGEGENRDITSWESSDKK